MSDKLVAWCKENDGIFLTALTPERAMRFRTSLPYRTGDSSSLSVHWAVITGCFSWAVGMGYIEKNPSPDTRIFPQFRIKYEQREVVPPTKQEMEKVLATATGRVGVLVRLMRESGMAFWQPGLESMPRAEWVKKQQTLVEHELWIMDGDLGKYDAVEVRLSAADTIILLDFALVRCAWRALRRGRERIDFWQWLVAYRRQSLPVLMQAISKFAPDAELHLIRNPTELRLFIMGVERKCAKQN